MTNDKLDRFTFADAEGYLSCLQSHIDQIDATGSYNFYLHQIGDVDFDYLRAGYSREVLYENLIVSILKNGLQVGKYGALAGTAKFIGNSTVVNPQDILRYSFDKNIPHNAVAIFALPRFVEVDGKEVEFSSISGKSIEDQTLRENLQTFYNQNGLSVAQGDMKCCLYDVVKQKFLPNAFLLGVQEIDRKTGKISFVDAGTHIFEKDDKTKKEFEEKIVQDIKRAYAKYGTDVLDELLLGATKKEYKSGQYDRDFEI